MEKTKTKGYLKELWVTFEKTGSIGAYLLYNDIRKRNVKTKRIKVKK